ncbi:MAG: DoxX family protein [Balneolales bacterium]|nr:DoxX family protein [Balneolales bacterium]
MEITLIISIAAKIIIAAGIYNVWLLRFNKATPYRGGNAKSMEEEFAAYGLPPVMMKIVGFLKIALATVLLLSIWSPALAVPAAGGMALLMVGALLMHVKVSDPVNKSVPALAMLGLSLLVVFLN